MVRKFEEYNEWKSGIVQDLEREAGRLSHAHGIEGFDTAAHEMARYFADAVMSPFFDPELPVPFYMAKNVFRMIGVSPDANVGQAARHLVLRASMGCVSVTQGGSA